MEKESYLLVEARVLPDVFLRVVEAKRLLARGDARSTSQAARMAGISRSAFYKYKDSVFTYQSDEVRRIVTLFCELVDEPGVLSGVLSCIGASGGNVLTINQSIPVDGVAPVSLSVSAERMRIGREELIDQLRALYGVVTLRPLTGE